MSLKPNFIPDKSMFYIIIFLIIKFAQKNALRCFSICIFSSFKLLSEFITKLESTGAIVWEPFAPNTDVDLVRPGWASYLLVKILEI